MPRAGLSSDAVVAIALDVVDGERPAALTLAAVAVRAGRGHPVAVQARRQPGRAAIPGLACWRS